MTTSTEIQQKLEALIIALRAGPTPISIRTSNAVEIVTASASTLSAILADFSARHGVDLDDMEVAPCLADS